MICFPILIGPLLWMLGGLIGGYSISILISDNEFSRSSLIKSWTIGFGVGGFAWIIFNPIIGLLFDTIIQGPYIWGWSIIPITLNLAVAGIVAAQVGSRMLYTFKRET